MAAEASDLLQGLQFSLDKGYCKILVEIDPLSLMQLVLGLATIPWKIDHLVLMIQQLINQANIFFQHCYR